jgi:hypothetical protein
MRILPDKQNFQTLVDKHINGLLKNNSLCRTNKFCLFFNNKCILRYFKGQTEKMIIHDDNNSLIKYNNYDFLCDKSYIYYKPLETLQLPINMNELNLIQYVYKKDKKSDVTLFIEQLETGIIRDIWFEIPDELVDNIITLDIICSFLEN